jgi:hypothetical protein
MAIYLGFVLYLKVRASGRLRHGSCLVHDDDGPGDLSSQTFEPFDNPNPNPLPDQT